MLEPSFSPAVHYAWQIAAEEAIQAGAPSIEPEHLLLGLLGLEKLVREPAPKGVSASDMNAIRAELDLVLSALPDRSAATKLRRAVRSRLPHGEAAENAHKISRSETSRRVFADAASLSAGAATTLSAFAIALSDALSGPWRSLATAFGLNLDCARTVWQQGAHSALRATPNAAPAGNPSETAVRLTREVESLDATINAGGALSSGGDAAPRLALLMETVWAQAPEKNLDDFLQSFLERLMSTLPAAGRGAILIPDSSTRLLLRAHVPIGAPSVSVTSAHRAMQEKRGVIWQEGDDLTVSQQQSSAQSGMYAPLIWNNVVFGVVCVDNYAKDSGFRRTDLTVLVAAAHHLALAVANEQLRIDLQTNTRILERLLSSFSPKLRSTLLEKARKGRLRLGGESSEVTVLFCDMRGFTQVSAAMSSEDVLDMLNVYFPALTETIFKYEGTVDKYIGDAVLAVFGSPEADTDQYSHALRCAIEMQERVREVNADRQKKKLPSCDVGIAVHCGDVLHGFIGSEDRMEFTVIGDTVNRTSRLCGGAGPGEIVLSPEFYKRVWNEVEAVQTSVPSKHEGNVPAYRVRGLRGRTAHTAS